MPKQTKQDSAVSMRSSFFGYPEVQQRSVPTSATHNFYIYGEIDDLHEYVDMIATLDYSQENDIVHIYLNTPGGNLNTTISIIHAMMRSKAQIVTHADGEVASAGTLIFFAGQMYIVYPYSHFMFHDASGGAIGKVNENIKRIHATAELLDKIAYDLYTPVFSEEEVDEILEGKDYYCGADEMYDRIKAVNEADESSESENQNDSEESSEKELLLEADEDEYNSDSEETHYSEEIEEQPEYVVSVKGTHDLNGAIGKIDLHYFDPKESKERLILRDGTVIYVKMDYLHKLA